MTEDDDRLHCKAYLGDGAYVQIGSYMGEVLITAEDGVNILQRVALDEECTLHLIEWLQERGWKIRLGANEPTLSTDPAYEGQIPTVLPDPYYKRWTGEQRQVEKDS